MATYCRHPYIQLCARSSVSLRSGGSILQSKAGPFLASGEEVSIKHLGRYCNEFSYRFNRRGNQAGLFDSTVKGLVNGKALRFKSLIASVSESPSDVSR